MFEPFISGSWIVTTSTWVYGSGFTFYITDFFSRSEDIQDVLEGRVSHDVVVTDRYCMSTMAYQTIGLTGKRRKKMLDWIMWLCYEGKPRLHKPDLIIFLDTPLEVSLKRLKGKPRDMHEKREKLAAFSTSYSRVAKEQGWQVVSNVDEAGKERSKQDIHQDIWDVVTRHVQ